MAKQCRLISWNIVGLVKGQTINMKCELRHLREKHDLSRERLAARAGVHPNSIKLLEYGQMRPSVEIARKIAAALDCHIDDLWPPELQP